MLAQRGAAATAAVEVVIGVGAVAGIDGPERELEALRGRLSGLIEASLRINQSLDFDSVLQDVVDSACALTGAPYGAITINGDAGQVEGFVTSGVADEEHRRLQDEDRRFFEHIGSLVEPLRIANLTDYTRSLGLPDVVPPVPVTPVPVTSVLMSPILHGEASVGAIYLARLAPSVEFSRADEEVLSMFASQAARVISNALRCRDPRPARAGLEALIEIAPVGVTVFDARTGRPVSCNRETHRIFKGLRPVVREMKDLLKGVQIVRRATGREMCLEEYLGALIHLLRDGGVVRADEIEIVAGEGKPVAVLLNSTAVFSPEDASVESVIVTFQDMEPIQQMERLRAEFLAMVSHELRTPLAAIKGSTATLLEASGDLDPAEARQFHRIISAQADLMRDMVSDLLDVAHIETGTLSVDPEPSELPALADQARNTFLRSGGTHDVNIDLPEDLPAIMADRRRVVQVLGNLLSNSARHSPVSHAITVSAEAEEVHVAVTVTDRGLGIPEEQLPQLFGKFSRLAGVGSGLHAEGTGLGLAICKGIVEAHGGRIRAVSDGPGLGSRFTFTLPVAQQSSLNEAAAAAQPSVKGPAAAQDHQRILVVDDDPQTLRHIRGVLSEAGYTPVVTADPDEAPGLMGRHRPHLALLDLVLPGTDGIELMHRLRGIDDMPVIFVSAYGRDHHIERAFEAGAADYLVKPFSTTELVARIKAALRRQDLGDRAALPEPFHLGALRIDYAQRRVTIDERPVQLTPTEYALLRLLSTNAGRVLTHRQLHQHVWGGPNHPDPQALRTHMRRLRQKLEDDAHNPTYIFTELRVGYRMASPDQPHTDTTA